MICFLTAGFSWVLPSSQHGRIGKFPHIQLDTFLMDREWGTSNHGVVFFWNTLYLQLLFYLFYNNDLTYGPLYKYIPLKTLEKHLAYRIPNFYFMKGSFDFSDKISDNISVLWSLSCLAFFYWPIEIIPFVQFFSSPHWQDFLSKLTRFPQFPQPT